MTPFTNRLSMARNFQNICAVRGLDSLIFHFLSLGCPILSPPPHLLKSNLQGIYFECLASPCFIGDV